MVMTGFLSSFKAFSSFVEMFLLWWFCFASRLSILSFVLSMKFSKLVMLDNTGYLDGCFAGFFMNFIRLYRNSES